MPYRFIFLLFIVFLFAIGCVPINSCFDSARMLQKNQVSVKGNYSSYIYNENNESNSSNYNYGIGLGYGISDRLNIQSRYELITFPDNSTDFYHYFDIAAKYSFITNRLAGSLPFGVYAAQGEEPTFVTSPRVIASYPFDNHIELTCSAKADLFFEEDSDIPLGFTFGLGLSRDLNIWALRPEAGYMINPGGSGTSFTFGIGLNYNFSPVHR